jgi:hypothetical protein
LSKIKDLTGSAPELVDNSVMAATTDAAKKLIAVKSTDKQLTNSSNSLKPVTRGQIFRKQANKKVNNEEGVLTTSNE